MLGVLPSTVIIPLNGYERSMLLKRICMYKRVVPLGILAAILLSLWGGGRGAIAARDPHWRDHYKPPYMGVKHAIYSIETRDPFAGALLFDLPATFVVDTCLLPWDLVTVLSKIGE